MMMKNWKVMLIVAIHCLIYFDDDLVFFSSAAAADPNRTLADDRVAKGFISIDCGMIEDSRYDNNAWLHYTSDEEFINTGIKSNVEVQFKLPVYNTLRSFPEGERNCYTLKPKQGKNCSYLIRVCFLYGNYDGKSSFPRFHLYIDVNFWIEVAPHAFGIKDDPYDREWSRVQKSSAVWGTLRSDESMMKTSAIITEDAYKLPPSVLKTAAIPVHDDTGSLDFYYNNVSQNDVLQVYWHFAEIQKLRINDSREFTITFNGKSLPGKISPKYMEASTIVSSETTMDGNDSIVFNITRTPKSTLPPILNALEIYEVLHLPKSATNQDDVNAIMNIKMHYTMTKAWQGDPCRPAPVWNGLNCSEDDDNHSPRITSLNLTAKGLEGDIPGSLSKLTSLTHLNLSYNSLTGVIPDFLADLPALQTLDLKSNKLSGQVPPALSKKAEEGTLDLSLEDNPDLCISSSCNKKNWKKIGAILAAVALSITLIVTATVAVYKYKQKKQARNILCTSTKSGSVRFTHMGVISMTNNFQNIIGVGGSGIVYRGCLQDGTPVAVKMLNPSSALSMRLFSTEAELLTRVHHRNLVSLKGYCEEGPIMALIYEHVANGNLQQYLSEKNAKVLCWKERLQIATEAAQGLEYLHSGCNPSIVHRDMKTSNILLDENFHVKISDFGISKAFSTERTESALVTKVMGTHGYLDPEYYITQRLQKKSDVYSFGVVLLELITGQPSIIRSGDEPIHVAAWTSPKFERGDINNIVDERLQGHFNTNSAWKVLEVAMECVSATGIQRPTMNQVLVELKDCLAIEIDHQMTRNIGNYESAYQPTYSIKNDSVVVDSSIEMGPSPR